MKRILKSITDFLTNIPKWHKDNAEPFDPIEPVKPQPLIPHPDVPIGEIVIADEPITVPTRPPIHIKPEIVNPPIEPPKPVEVDK